MASEMEQQYKRRVAESNRYPWQDLPIISRLQATGLSPSQTATGHHPTAPKDSMSRILRSIRVLN